VAVETALQPVNRIERAFGKVGLWVSAGTRKIFPYAVGAVLMLLLTTPFKGCSLPNIPWFNPTPDVPVVPVVPVVPTVKQKMYVIFAADDATITPAQAAIMASPTLRAQLAAAGHIVRLYKKGQTEIDSLGLAAPIQTAGGYPALLVQEIPAVLGTPSKLHAAVPLPNSEPGVIAAVQAAGGF
jgi:hypothetical protein